MGTTKSLQKRGTDGQFTLFNKWERICKRCGNKLGNHEAEKPHANDDATMGPECEGFKR